MASMMKLNHDLRLSFTW